MKFKVGDKVKVRSGLKVGEIYNGLCYVKPMQKYEGKTLTISGIDDDNNRWYFVEEDGEEWCWTDDMLELNVDSSMTASKVMEWFSKADCHMLAEVVDDVLGQFEAKGIITRTTAYEATKKAPKPVEVEYGKLLYVSVRNADTGFYQSHSSFEYWPDEQAESYETAKTTFLSEAAKETQKTVRLSEYDICRIKESES